MRLSGLRWALGVLTIAVVATWTAPVDAYPLYESTATPGVDDCSHCHGGFLTNPYQRCDGGANNGVACTAASECPAGTCTSLLKSLHDIHRNDMLGAASSPDANRCNICHLGASKTPVVVNESNGTTGFDPISCVGCHGRAQDRGTRPTDCVDAASTNGPCGDGAGLRQHHERSGVTVCGTCHSDALPANFTPVGESVLPPYYFTPDALHPQKPTDPCNPNGEEDFAGSSKGLDNDGDLLYDLADPDCPTPTATVTPTVLPTPTPTATPNKESQKCQAAIVKSAAAFVQAKTKALQKCDDGVVKRKVPGPCPDEKAAGAISNAVDKLTAGIAKACGGKDKTCGTGGDDVAIPVLGWTGSCPDFEGKGCTNAIGDCHDITDCVECIGEAAVDQAIGLYYGALQPTDPKSSDKREKTLNKCQATIGKGAAAFLGAQSKALRKCWDAKLKAKVTDCPDAAANDAITTATAKLASAIAKSCGGKDKQIGGVGENADFTPAEIGFAASCADVTVPGLGASCSGAIDDLQSIVGCVTCVTGFKAGCADGAGAIGLAAYPAECNP